MLGLALALAGALAAAEQPGSKGTLTVAVGPPAGAAVCARVDAAQTGRSKVRLPTTLLSTRFRKSLSTPNNTGLVVTKEGHAITLSTRGEATTYDDNGEQLARQSIPSLTAASAPVLVSNGSVLFLTNEGDAVAARPGAVRPEVSPLGMSGREGISSTTLLPLLDGGAAALFGREFALLDSQGAIRSRSVLPEASQGAAALGGTLYVLGVSGTVHSVRPGHAPVRVGTFGAPVPQGIVARTERSLLGVTSTGALIDLDPQSGTNRTIAAPDRVTFMGPPTLGPPGITFLLGLTATHVVAVRLDGNDMATSVTDLAPLLPSMLPDGGAGVPPTAIPHAAAIADAEGTLAFLAPDGRIGVMTAARGVSTTGEAVCARAFGRNPTPATGVMAPAAEGGIFVQCEGILARVDGKTDR